MYGEIWEQSISKTSLHVPLKYLSVFLIHQWCISEYPTMRREYDIDGSYSLLSNNHHIPIMVSNNIDHQLIGNTLFPDKPMSTHGGIDVRSYCMQKTGDVSNQNKTWCETAEPRWMRRDTSVHDQQKMKQMIWSTMFCSAANFPTENPQVKMPARVARQKMWRAFLAGGMLEGQ